MKMIDLKKLKPKDIYKWPLKAQMLAGGVLAIFVLLLGYFFIISDQYSELEQARDKEEQLKTEFVDKNKQAVNLNLYKQQLVEITQASDALLKQLPNKSEVEKLLIDINQSGVGRGLKFDLFKPNQQKLTEYYAELPISIKLAGTYDSIGNFASDVSQLSRVVILKDLNLSLPNDKTDLIVLSATAQTFRYLDQDEIDAQKAEKKKNKKEKKKDTEKTNA